MPTPAERRALLFLSTLLAMGGAARAFAAHANGNPEPSPDERAALDTQLHAVDSARAAAATPKRKRRATRSANAEPAIAPGSGVSQPLTPTLSQPPLLPRAPRGTRAPRSDASASTPATRVDLDVAPPVDIQRLPRIGPVLARRIAADRDSLGPFGSLQELARVRGVGPALLRILEPYVTFSLQPRPHRVDDPDGRGTTRKARRGRSRVSGPPP